MLASTATELLLSGASSIRLTGDDGTYGVGGGDNGSNGGVKHLGVAKTCIL
jgi:hypothetical protein